MKVIEFCVPLFLLNMDEDDKEKSILKKSASPLTNQPEVLDCSVELNNIGNSVTDLIAISDIPSNDHIKKVSNLSSISQTPKGTRLKLKNASTRSKKKHFSEKNSKKLSARSSMSQTLARKSGNTDSKSCKSIKRKRMADEDASTNLKRVSSKWEKSETEPLSRLMTNKKPTSRRSSQDGAGCSHQPSSFDSNQLFNDSMLLCDKQETNYVPTLSQILQTFPAEMTLCSLCHLPANFAPGLGDLYGPYRPNYIELMNRYDIAQGQISTTMNYSFKPSSSKEPEICIDRNTNTCYIPTSCFKLSNENCLDNEKSSLTVSGTNKSIKSIMPRMRMLHTVDCVLTEANKKPAAKISQAKKIHIPGFTGKLRVEGSPSNSNTRTLLHDIDSVVFVEPTVTLSNTSNSNRTSPKTRSSPKDNSSISVVHTFDTKAIWVHGACAVWSPEVHCVQYQLYGLTSAVRNAVESVCDYCHRRGATIPYRFKKKTNYHYICCLAKGLVLDYETFTATSTS